MFHFSLASVGCCSGEMQHFLMFCQNQINMVGRGLSCVELISKMWHSNREGTCIILPCLQENEKAIKHFRKDWLRTRLCLQFMPFFLLSYQIWHRRLSLVSMRLQQFDRIDPLVVKTCQWTHCCLWWHNTSSNTVKPFCCSCKLLGQIYKVISVQQW